MESDIIGAITEETKQKLREGRDFDEQEAYFLLCEIFAYAQATKDYAKFQVDLNEWKKRFPIELFSEGYKIKIKYMLSKEFLDTVLKNFIAFDELSKKDPSVGLEKLRKILKKAEKHKDEKELDKDLQDLYKEFPLKYLKEKYPHVVAQLLSKANRTRILEKFDSSLAFKELNNIVSHPENFENANQFLSTIEEWKKLYPTNDFNDKYKSDVEKTLTETLDSKKLEELFPVTTNLDLSLGEVIPLELQETVKDISLINKDALYDFFKIVDKNKGDINSLFNWTCKYSRYINGFDTTTKTAIVDNLMTKYGYELPPVGTKFQMPKMDSGMQDLLTLSEFNSINDTKKQVVLQLLGILSTGKELTYEDNYRLSTINANVKKAEIIKKAKIDKKTEIFVDEFPENKLTSSDDVYLKPVSETKLTIEFKNSLKVNETTTPATRVSGTSGSTDSGSNGGGWSFSIALNTTEESDTLVEEKQEEPKEKKENDSNNHEQNSFTLNNNSVSNNETFSDKQHKNPVKSFFSRFIKREEDISTDTDIDRDDR